MEKIKEDIKSVFIGKYDIECIVIFGSYVRESQTPQSDIDIAIKIKGGITKKELNDISKQLEEIIKKEVDLIDLDNANSILKYEILYSGMPIYIKNEYYYDLYVIDACNEFLEVNEDRESIINRIIAGGDIYGK